jgi:hypothetical protein
MTEGLGFEPPDDIPPVLMPSGDERVSDHVAGARLGAVQSSGAVTLSGSGGLVAGVVHPGTITTPGPALHADTGIARTHSMGRV